MSATDREALEGRVREAVEAGAVDRATELVLEGHGGEIFRFLHALTGNPDTASQAFSLFAEGVWKSLPRFEWRSSLRTWCYVIARRAALTLRREGVKARVQVPLSDAISQLERQVRLQTLTLIREERKSRLAELRNALPEDDRALLLLRVDKELEWVDIARALSEVELDEAALKRESARLRKRFQLVKERLVEAGKKAGLIDG